MEVFESNIVRLDEEFKQGLQNIRGYLINLASPHDARCCGEWLQKLRDSYDERELRNVLLQRLTSQVQTRKLEYPFNKAPSNKPLYKIYEDGDTGSWCTDDVESNTKDTFNTSVETLECCFKEEGAGDGYRSPREKNWFKLSGPVKPSLNKAVVLNTYYQDASLSPIRASLARTAQPEPSKLEGQKEIESPAIRNDTIKSEKDAKKEKMEELTSYIEGYKNLLSDYKRVINENITDLSDRLEAVIENNQAQKTDMNNLQSALQDTWSVKLQGLENELLSEVNKLECQLAADRSKYEAKIEHLKQVILEKDDKINSLDLKIKHQAVTLREKMDSVRNDINLAAKENEMLYRKKYSSMKKQLIKLENINKELVKQYEQNISLTVKDYEAKVKSAKLLGANESFMELENKIEQLEKYYQRVFLEYKRKMDSTSQKETKKIHFEDLG